MSNCQEKSLPLIQQHVSQPVEKQELEHIHLREKVEQLGEQSRKNTRNNEHIQQQLEQMKQQNDRIEHKFDNHEQKFDNLEQQLHAVLEPDLIAKAWYSDLVVDRYHNIEQLSTTVQSNQVSGTQARDPLIQYYHRFAHGGGSLRHQIEWIVDQVDNEGYRDYLAQNVDPIWASRTTDQIVEAWTLCSPTMLAQLDCKSIAMLLNCSLVI